MQTMIIHFINLVSFYAMFLFLVLLGIIWVFYLPTERVFNGLYYSAVVHIATLILERIFFTRVDNNQNVN